MNYVVVDNNKNDLDLLTRAIVATVPDCEVLPFTDPLMSAKYICNNPVDIAFLAAEMCPVDGLILMRSVRANKPALPIVIVSRSDQNKINAIHAGANGHLLKPISTDRLQLLVTQLAV